MLSGIQWGVFVLAANPNWVKPQRRCVFTNPAADTIRIWSRKYRQPTPIAAALATENLTAPRIPRELSSEPWCKDETLQHLVDSNQVFLQLPWLSSTCKRWIYLSKWQFYLGKLTRSDSRNPRNFDLFFCHINMFFCRTRHSNNNGQNLRGILESSAINYLV